MDHADARIPAGGPRNEQQIDTAAVDRLAEVPGRLAQEPFAAVSHYGRSDLSTRHDADAHTLLSVRARNQHHELAPRDAPVFVEILEILVSAKAPFTGARD
jgi:hypothetical protein